MRGLARVEFAVEDAHENGQQALSVLGLYHARVSVQAEDDYLMTEVLAFEDVL